MGSDQGSVDPDNRPLGGTYLAHVLVECQRPALLTYTRACPGLIVFLAAFEMSLSLLENFGMYLSGSFKHLCVGLVRAQGRGAAG